LEKKVSRGDAEGAEEKSAIEGILDASSSLLRALRVSA
jgi:hypothetical protein